MTTSIELLKIGERRRRTVVLKPGTYDLCNGNYVRLHRRATIEATEEFRKPLYDRAGWYIVAYHHDTLCAVPTRWTRLKAWLGRKQPIPRAIVITAGSASSHMERVGS